MAASQYLIYQNLTPFLKYRGLTWAGEYLLPNTQGPLPKEKFLTLIQQFGYYRLDAADGESTVIINILADGHGKYLQRAAVFQKFLLDILINKKIAISEIILIVPKLVFSRKNICDVVKATIDVYPDVYFNFLPYQVFLQVIPEVSIVCKHELVDKAEIAEIMDKDYLSETDLPTISSGDPPVVWIGGRPGQYVRIHRLSETTGTAITIRLIVKDMRY